MYLDWYNGALSWYGFVTRIMAIGNIGPKSGAYNFFSNFASNIVTAFNNGGNVWSVISIIPDFAYMLASFAPLSVWVRGAYQIGMLA